MVCLNLEVLLAVRILYCIRKWLLGGRIELAHRSRSPGCVAAPCSDKPDVYLWLTPVKPAKTQKERIRYPVVSLSARTYKSQRVEPWMSSGRPWLAVGLISIKMEFSMMTKQSTPEDGWMGKVDARCDTTMSSPPSITYSRPLLQTFFLRTSFNGIGAS